MGGPGQGGSSAIERFPLREGEAEVRGNKPFACPSRNAAILIMAQIVTLGALPLNRPDGREVLECGGWRGTGLAPLWPTRGGPNPKRCVP